MTALAAFAPAAPTVWTGSAAPAFSIWTPLPDSPSGIAHYADTLFARCDSFADAEFVVAEAAERRHPRARAAEDRRAGPPRDFLQLGNNPFHAHVYARAMEGGGIVELHDLSLHHLLTTLTLARGDAQAYRQQLEADEGEWGRRFAMQRLKGFYSPRLEFYARASRAVCDRARAVIVHSDWARVQLEMQGVGTPVHVIPHFAVTPDESHAVTRSRVAARARFGVPEGAFLILSAGFVSPAKKTDWVLDAVERLYATTDDFLYVIAGRCEDQRFLDRLRGSPARSRIRVTGYASDSDFDDWTLAADVLPILRFPSAGESSGVAARALGFGRAILTPEYMAFSDIPDEVCVKIHLDRDPVDQIAAALIRLHADREALRDLEWRAAEYAATALSPATTRTRIRKVLEEAWTL